MISMLKLKEGTRSESICLMEYGEEKEIRGSFRLDGKERLKLDLKVTHVAANTRAKVIIRGVIGGEARAEISGMLLIGKKAFGTDSFFGVHILLLSEAASCDVRPMLEILAHEVKAAHAATIGKVDAEQVFYLTSRGLSPDAAVEMIVNGWLIG